MQKRQQANIFEVRVNDQPRTYRVMKEHAFEVAASFKKDNLHSVVAVRDMRTGLFTVLSDEGPSSEQGLTIR